MLTSGLRLKRAMLKVHKGSNVEADREQFVVDYLIHTAHCDYVCVYSTQLAYTYPIIAW